MSVYHSYITYNSLSFCTAEPDSRGEEMFFVTQRAWVRSEYDMNSVKGVCALFQVASDLEMKPHMKSFQFFMV